MIRCRVPLARARALTAEGWGALPPQTLQRQVCTRWVTLMIEIEGGFAARWPWPSAAPRPRGASSWMDWLEKITLQGIEGPPPRDSHGWQRTEICAVSE